MKPIKRFAAMLLAILLLACPAGVAAGAPKDETDEGGMSWPRDRAFPVFSAPEEALIAFPADLFPAEEMLALACLQGFANARKTRVVILDGDVETWLGEYGYSFIRVTPENAYDYIRELAADAAGAVLYATDRSREYMNLASSVGNTMRAIPLTDDVYARWTENGVALPVLADLRALPYTEPVDIYRWFFDRYWTDCTHRLLVVQRPDLPFQMRDLAAAVGGAVVYLSCAGGAETKLFKAFLNTMTPGESILTGWYAGQERELMTVAAQCGLSCVPSDFFRNPTVFAQSVHVKPPAVPKTPALANKIYIAYFLSDGDNIQYDMGMMRHYWDDNRQYRGQVPVNWTISPALVDIAPGMMNYYYAGATDSECFVCGPSGMGYTMPVNTFGGNTGNQFRSAEKFSAFVGLSDRYLQKAGLRAVTIWDNLTRRQRRIYAGADYLYGLTVQNFTNASLRLRYTGVTKNMLFMQMTPGYFASNAEGTTPLTQIENDITEAVKYLRYDGKAPVFVATQASVWAFHNIADVIALEQHLSDRYAADFGEDVVEFVRADHFFNLYYEAHDLPQDLKLKPALTAVASDGEDAARTTDGVCSADSMWTAAEAGAASVTYSLGAAYEVDRISLYHAEAAGLDPALNTRAFRIEVSADGETWREAAAVAGNSALRSTVRFAPRKAAFVRITITDPGGDGVARLADVDIFGRDASHARCPKCARLHDENVFDKMLGWFHRVFFLLGHLC